MTQAKPHVAVVILSWNGKDYLKSYLPSVLKTEYPNCSIYVADNASSDGTVVWLKATFPEVKIVETGYNAGFAEGYNIALKQIEADYFVLLNQDVAVEPNWLGILVDKAESDKSIGACQPKLLADKKRDYYEYAGAAGGFLDKWYYPFCRGRFFDVLEKNNKAYDSEMEIAWGSGACLFIRADLFLKSGGLDKDFFAHMEEIDLCWRIKNAGYTIFACPKSVVYHLGGGSLNYGNPRKTHLNFRNNLRMIVKNAPDHSWKKVLFIRFFLDQLSAFYFLLSGHWGDFKAVQNAHFSFASELKKWVTKRKELKVNLDKIKIGKPSKSGFYKKSIVYQFFVKKKKSFSELDRGDFE